MQPAHQSALDAERAKFRASLPDSTEALWSGYPGRIGVVLSGGGARGAYEAGVLMAFQDAKLPTHIITATSVGSINAASYAAHSDTLVGNAESLVESWSEVTPPAVGIDWFRYILVLGGLTAMTAGFGNLLRQWADDNDIFVHLTQPKLTWFTLGLTGTAFLYFHDQTSYLWHVLKNYLHKRPWQPHRAKVWRSLAGNLIVVGCLVMFFAVAHLHLAALEMLDMDASTGLIALAAFVMLLALLFLLRKYISLFSHKFLRLPLRTGLFPNFERTRFLRGRLQAHRIRNSPIRVAMTAAHVNDGTERCFINSNAADLLQDPGVDADFVTQETTTTDDPLMAVIASSAFPIVYETVPLHGGLWTDGGIVSNQPIRPAIRLGADVLFLVMVEPRTKRRGEIKTFMDMGVRAIEILMSQNLKTDLKILSGVNSLCEQYAAGLGIRPEQIRLLVGPRHYRYMKPIIIAPDEPLAATVLDFDGHITGPAILQGYQDGARAVQAFADYLRQLPTNMQKFEVKLVAEKLSTAAVN